MNPVFWLLVLIAAFFLWVFISFVFIPFGGYLKNKYKKFNYIINYDEEEKTRNGE